MPITQDIQATTPKSSTPSEVQPKPSPVMVSTEQKPAVSNTGMPGRMDPKPAATNPQPQRNPDAKRPWDAGRSQNSVNPVGGGNQSGTTTEQEKDARPVATL